MVRITLLLAMALAIGWGVVQSASAHPLDRLSQHLLIDLTPGNVDLTLAMGGGILANEIVMGDIDPDGDGKVSATERQAWLATLLEAIEVSVDGQPVAIEASAGDITVPPLEDFHVGVSPLIVRFHGRLLDAKETGKHQLTVKNRYHLDLSDHRFDTFTADGATVIDAGWPAATIHIAYAADHSIQAAANPATRAASGWKSGRVIDRSRQIFEHAWSPSWALGLVAIFLALGALHALQPGHGKTLVAAYMVATGGTVADGLTLAAIVTLTHTISVFALGGLTLVASEFFLPSRVIPAVSLLSGVLIVALGLRMLRGLRGRPNQAPLDDLDGHHHDHDHLSEEEHARLHLQPALDLRQGVSRRNLVALGVTGGLTPCPDALAILLLAIGLGHPGLGMAAVAIFSIGLAAVLVAFGVGIAIAGPAWRAMRGRRGSDRVMPAAFGRAIALAPAASAIFVMFAGLAMIWQASAGFRLFSVG